MKIIIATDNLQDQLNGVATTLKWVRTKLEDQGHTILIIDPSQFVNIPLPGYKEIRIAINFRKVKRLIANFDPDAIHIMTEGPIGLATRNYCQRKKIPYNTSYHTKFPEFIKERIGLPLKPTYAFLKWFHRDSHKVLITTESMKRELSKHGFNNLVIWGRGADPIYHPRPNIQTEYARPIFLSVGRISPEKNLPVFMKSNLLGTKIVVGSGPFLEKYKKQYPDVIFLGPKVGEELANLYAMADVFAFPSLTDTLGIVQIEAMASGTPVAAYPVTGPIDIIEQGITGFMDEDFEYAAKKCLELDKIKCAEAGKKFSWDSVADIFLKNLSIIPK